MSHAAWIVVPVVAIMAFFLFVNSLRALLLAAGVPELWSHWRLPEDEYFQSLVGSDALPPISVIATVFGGEEEVVRLALMLLDLDYPRHEVVIVNDGSLDGTMASLSDALALHPVPPAFTVHVPTERVRGYYRSRSHPRLLVLDKEHGGRADAMNAGLNAARYPQVLAIGRNVTFERDALLRLTRPFLLDRNVVAVGGALRPIAPVAAEGREGGGRQFRLWLAGVQTVEYMREFLYERIGWNHVASNLLFPGHVALFRREHAFEIAGFRRGVTEPGLDFAVRLHHHLTERGVNPAMPVIPDAVAWTRVPGRLAHVREVRQRWQRGMLAALRDDTALAFDPAAGMFGVAALPYAWAVTAIAPPLELLGYALLGAGILAGAVAPPLAAAYLAATAGYGILLSVWTVVLDSITARAAGRTTSARLLIYAIVAELGYRQWVAWCRIRA